VSQIFHNLEIKPLVDSLRGEKTCLYTVSLQSKKQISIVLTFDFDINTFVGSYKPGDFHCMFCFLLMVISKNTALISSDDCVQIFIILQDSWQQFSTNSPPLSQLVVAEFLEHYIHTNILHLENVHQIKLYELNVYSVTPKSFWYYVNESTPEFSPFLYVHLIFMLSDAAGQLAN
jgi:hypothetical protein